MFLNRGEWYEIFRERLCANGFWYIARFGSGCDG